MFFTFMRSDAPNVQDQFPDHRIDVVFEILIHNTTEHNIKPLFTHDEI